ncbi:hypothetical protein [Streptomyces mutabilis]|nr:hypothetical protein [Streptomyces mutabilis]
MPGDRLLPQWIGNSTQPEPRVVFWTASGPDGAVDAVTRSD